MRPAGSEPGAGLLRQRHIDDHLTLITFGDQRLQPGQVRRAAATRRVDGRDVLAEPFPRRPHAQPIDAGCLQRVEILNDCMLGGLLQRDVACRLSRHTSPTGKIRTALRAPLSNSPILIAMQSRRRPTVLL